MKFDGSYMLFAAGTQPFLRADDVGYAVTEFMWFKGRPFYPMGALTEAKVACFDLSAPLADEADEDNLDLVFQMRGPDGGHLFEIVLRSNRGTAYGGWLWGNNVEILDEFVDGYRVLSTSYEGEPARFEYRRELGRYQFTGQRPVEKTPLAQADEQRPYRGAFRIETQNGDW